MEDVIELALEERRKYKEACKGIVVRTISRLFSAVPFAQRVEFFMDMPTQVITPYRDNPYITDLSLFNSQGELLRDDGAYNAMGELNLILNLCGMCLIDLFSCGRVVLNREHYTT